MPVIGPDPARITHELREAWFAVRCFFVFTSYPGDDEASDRAPVYEERVTLWKASDFDGALEQAAREAESYCRDTDCAALPLMQCYQLADAPAHGTEVFSLLRGSALTSADYLHRHFDTGDERQGLT